MTVNDFKIERRYPDGGLSCLFTHNEQEYLADLCVISFGTECAIFKAVDRQITFDNALPLYVKKDIPITESNLLSCINDFIRTNK